MLKRMPKGVSRSMRHKVFNAQKKQGLCDIPCFIVSYNRLSYLKQSIEWLERMGHKRIIIIDNASTYQPLLEYYDTLPYEIIRLESNYGHLVFWRHEMFKSYRESFYYLTDPDIVPVEECPADYPQLLFKLLKRYPYIKKAGFSLKIDDVPSDGSTVFGSKVYDWEKQFYEKKQKDCYLANIDTTFALYAPDSITGEKYDFRAVRTIYPYQVRHLPWYKKKDELSDEDIYYSHSRGEREGWWDPVSGSSGSDKSNKQ